MLASLELLALNLFKNMLEKGQEWSESYFKWLDQRKQQLYSLMRLMPLEVLDMITVRVEIMKFKEQC